MEAGAQLKDQDVASGDDLTVLSLDAPILRVGVAPVARRSLTFFVSHDVLLRP